MSFSATFKLITLLVVFNINFSSGYIRDDGSESHQLISITLPVFREGGNKTCNHDADPDDFPEDLFTEEQLAHGAVIFYVFGAIYFFTLLAVVCNDYFLPSVECICQDLNIPKDVAAATFMATATTMPEFFTNTISTLVTNSDMGIGTIIGSLMFNTLGVAALSGMALNKSLQLDWWPVTRDCIFYSFNVIVLISVSWGGIITFTESLVMVILCLTYYVVIFVFNHFLVKPIKGLVEDKMNCCTSQRYDLTNLPENNSKVNLTPDPNPGQDGIFTVNGNGLPTNGIPPKNSVSDDDEIKSKNPLKHLFQCPTGSLKEKIWFFYSWPIKFVLGSIVPNPVICRKFYPLTFIMCIALIGGNAYMIVWMLTIFGNTIRVPDIVMGLTFLAAGSAMPESLSSVISVRKGESGIGVSNALGANSLAILLSLGAPWFAKNCLNYGKPDGENVIHIYSQGIEYTIGILLLSTLSLFIIMSFARFRLRRTVGFVLISVYAVFITLQILIEMNVFFPPRTDC